MSIIEDRREQQRIYAEAKLQEYRERHPTVHPHLLTVTLHQGASARVTCPGQAHCSLWYKGSEERPGRCGVEVECEEVGSEFLEWQIGPEFTPAVNPIAIGFTWSGGGDDDPPEIEWWPV